MTLTQIIGALILLALGFTGVKFMADDMGLREALLVIGVCVALTALIFLGVFLLLGTGGVQ